MNFEFPFNLVAKTPAKASEVMANLNKIKALLEGGLDQSVFSESGKILMGSIAQTVGSPTVGTPAGPFALTGEETIVVPAASKMLLTVTADMEAQAVFGGPNNKVFGRVTPYLDNAPLGIYCECGNQSPQVTAGGVSAGVGTTKVQGGSAATEVFAIGAGTHHLKLMGTTAYESNQGFPVVVFWTSFASYVIVPN